MEEDNQDFIYFTILEDVFSKGSSLKMDEEVWRNLPEDLQHMVLLWLPAASQARLSRVCRRWRKLMKSASFREKTAAVAWNSGGCKAIFTGKHYPKKHEVIRDASGASHFKVHKVSLDTFPSDFPRHVPGPFTSHYRESEFQIPVSREFQWLAHCGVLAVAVEDKNTLQVCVLDLANESWQELPRLVLEVPSVAGIWAPRSWQACLYDAAYDLQQRRWRYKVFVSWLRQRGDDDDEDQDYEKVCARTSFHVYSSTTNSWAILATALEPAEEAADLLDSLLHPVYLMDYVVGQGKTLHIYAKAYAYFDCNEEHDELATDGDLESLDMIRFSMEGRVIESFRAVEDRLQWCTWPVLLDASMTPYCVVLDCTIYRREWRQWTETSRLPPEVRAKMVLSPAEREELHRRYQYQYPNQNRDPIQYQHQLNDMMEPQRLEVQNAYMVDPIIFLDVQVDGVHGYRDGYLIPVRTYLVPRTYHVVAYHMDEDSWEWIAQHSSPWSKHTVQFLST